MAAYPADSPQGRAGAVLAAAGLDVNPRLRGQAPGTSGQVHVQLGPYVDTQTLQLNVVLFGAPGADLWTMGRTAWVALRAADGYTPLRWAPLYAPDGDQVTITVNTTERV